MKKKVGTIIDEELMFKAKQIALSQRQSLSQLLEDALRIYLLTVEKRKTKKGKEISERTRGAMKVSPSVLKVIMEEEGVYEA